MLTEKISNAIRSGQADAEKYAGEIIKILQDIVDNQNEQAKASMAIWKFLTLKYPDDAKLFDKAEHSLGIKMEVE